MKFFVYLLAAAMVLSLLAGCGTGAATSERIDTAAQTEDPSGSPAQDPGEIPASSAASAENDIGEIAAIEISVTRGTLYIRSGGELTLTHNGSDADYQIEEGALCVQCSQDGDTVLILPDGGPYERLSLTAAECHLYCEAPLQLQTLTLDASHSEITLDAISVTERTALSVRQGASSLSGDLGPIIIADCDEGQLSLSLDQAAHEYACDLTVTEGIIQLGDDTYRGRSLSKRIEHDSDRSMELSCRRGSLSVVFCP